MTFEEAIKAIKSNTHWCGIACDGDEDCDRHSLMYYENAFDIVCKLQETYAPKIKMTKKEADMLKSLKRTPQIDVGIVDYSKREPKVLLSNEFKFVDAWLHPELIEVSDD